MFMYQLVLCTKALDKAYLKFKLPIKFLYYPLKDYVENEELVSSTIYP